MAGKSSADGDEVISDINVTPLVDIMLVLLIIFLITIPAVLEQVPVELPIDGGMVEVHVGDVG